MTRTIWILTIAAAFVAGTIATGSIAFADDDNEFTANLSGASEVPPVATDTTGKAEFKASDDKLKFKLKIKKGVGIFAGPGAHIHCGAEGMNGGIVAFLAGGVAVGLEGKIKVEGTLTDANVNGAVGCGSTISELVDSMRAGNTYVNVHSSANVFGEIRGQIHSDGDDND